MSESKFDKVSYNNEFNKQRYDRIAVMLPHQDESANIAAVKAHTEHTGESVNAFVIRAIREQMKRDWEAWRNDS